MRKLLSYLFPLRKKIKTKLNGELEIVWVDGEKQLNGKVANYSYGLLQRILEKGLARIPIKTDGRVLLLGLGGGSILWSLREKFNAEGEITAVEIDPVLIEVSKKQFGINQLDHIDIIQADAYEFVKNCQQKFDLIIVDVFLELNVPDPFFRKDFWNTLIGLLNEGGQVLFNAGLLSTARKKCAQVIPLLRKTMSVKLFKSITGNLLIIASKNSKKS